MKPIKYVVDILRGMVIGLANLIPGVSGGTMMVSMGIYDTLINAINNLFKQFKKSVLVVLPYLIGMVLAIGLGAFGLKKAFADIPLMTNTLFIGLIVGSIPAILKQVKGEKIGVVGIVCFVLLFAAVVVLKLVSAENSQETLPTGILNMIVYFLLGMIASATMVIPGVSGSMILKTLGYYEPIVTVTLTDFMSSVKAGQWSAVGHDLLILLPFGLGIVVGIFAIAKLIAVLLKRWKGYTYCAILGMVVASPVVILMDKTLYAPQNTGILMLVGSVLTFALGFLIALLFAGDPEQRDTLQ